MMQLIPWVSMINILIQILFQVTLRYGVFVPPKMYRLHAVSRFEGIESYYRRLRRATFGDPPQEFSTSKEKIKARKMVCQSILKSYYFEMRGEEYVDVDAVEVHDELKNLFPTIFYSLYKENENRTNPRVGVDDYKYDSDYAVRMVSVLGWNEDEYVITCLARGRHTKRFKKYFVSQPYNVNSVPLSSSNIHGRFIFSRRSNGNLGLIAMAEEAAYHWWLSREMKTSSWVYIMLREFHSQIAPDARLDPICTLSAVNKLRLCTSLFGDPMFRRKGFKFKPTLKNVLLTCVKKQVVFFEPVFSNIPLFEWLERTMRRPFRRFEEWTIGCKALSSKGDRVIFHVSRAESKHVIFVYKKSTRPGHVTLYNLFMNLSVVDQLRPFVGETVETFMFDDVED